MILICPIGILPGSLYDRLVDDYARSMSWAAFVLGVWVEHLFITWYRYRRIFIILISDVSDIWKSFVAKNNPVVVYRLVLWIFLVNLYFPIPTEFLTIKILKEEFVPSWRKIWNLLSWRRRFIIKCERCGYIHISRFLCLKSEADIFGDLLTVKGYEKN